MATKKIPVYQEKDAVCNPVLIKQLYEAVGCLEEAMRATIPITRSNSSGAVSIGFGTSKTQKDIAVDTVISIARAIKSLKGW